ncbi:MAG TPA: hypothetical protein VKG78_02920 [Opitutaceae bacterium]|nr:hypothetical protein [Opitutaceae bacterium]
MAPAANQDGADGAERRRGISGGDAALRARLRLAGALILAAGLPSAAMVYRAAPAEDGGPYAIMAADTKRYEDEMERIGGKSNRLATECRDWLASLLHGRRLARTLGAISAGGSLACFFLAHRLGVPPREDRPADGPDP